jgi:hypothetical protein
LWINNLNFIKDVPMIYVNFIILVIIVYEKKIGGITFVPSLVNTKCFLDVCELNETISSTLFKYFQ